MLGISYWRDFLKSIIKLILGPQEDYKHILEFIFTFRWWHYRGRRTGILRTKLTKQAGLLPSLAPSTLCFSLEPNGFWGCESEWSGVLGSLGVSTENRCIIHLWEKGVFGDHFGWDTILQSHSSLSGHEFIPRDLQVPLGIE